LQEKIFSFAMKMTWLFGGLDSSQQPSYKGIVIPAEAGIHILEFSFMGVGKIAHECL